MQVCWAKNKEVKELAEFVIVKCTNEQAVLKSIELLSAFFPDCCSEQLFCQIGFEPKAKSHPRRQNARIYRVPWTDTRWLQRRKTALLERCPLPSKQVRCELYAQYQVAILLYFCTDISLFLMFRRKILSFVWFEEYISVGFISITLWLFFLLRFFKDKKRLAWFTCEMNLFFLVCRWLGPHCTVLTTTGSTSRLALALS